ncbi:MAG: hypothetical protein AB1489_42770, partial [Acidobacteriota bacterium]
MGWKPLKDRLNDLPLILAGPILRHTTEDSVTVWLALKDSYTIGETVIKVNEVTLSVYTDEISTPI